MEKKIIVKGARTHNLKNITVEMPRNKMIAITGLSGSGKSSLAFDTIFAEGQRRYVESLSAYARQFLRQMQKPDVDEITGLSPAISIDQKSRSNNPRSTVATITEIYDYLRVLYARIGKPHCLTCGREIQKLSNDEIVSFVYDKVKDIKKDKKGDKQVLGVTYNTSKIQIFSPLVRGRKGEYYQMLYDLLSKGYLFVRIDGKIHNLREQIHLAKTKKHDSPVIAIILLRGISTVIFFRLCVRAPLTIIFFSILFFLLTVFNHFLQCLYLIPQYCCRFKIKNLSRRIHLLFFLK